MASSPTVPVAGSATMRLDSGNHSDPATRLQTSSMKGAIPTIENFPADLPADFAAYLDK